MCKRPAGQPLGYKTANRECVSPSIKDKVELLTHLYKGASVKLLCDECGVGVHFRPGYPNSGKKPLSGDPQVPNMQDKWSHTVYISIYKCDCTIVCPEKANPLLDR
jgi:hypothetical protein